MLRGREKGAHAVIHQFIFLQLNLPQLFNIESAQQCLKKLVPSVFYGCWKPASDGMAEFVINFFSLRDCSLANSLRISHSQAANHDYRIQMLRGRILQNQGWFHQSWDLSNFTEYICWLIISSFFQIEGTFSYTLSEKFAKLFTWITCWVNRKFHQTKFATFLLNFEFITATWTQFSSKHHHRSQWIVHRNWSP